MMPLCQLPAWAHKENKIILQMVVKIKKNHIYKSTTPLLQIQLVPPPPWKEAGLLLEWRLILL